MAKAKRKAESQEVEKKKKKKEESSDSSSESESESSNGSESSSSSESSEHSSSSESENAEKSSSSESESISERSSSSQREIAESSSDTGVSDTILNSLKTKFCIPKTLLSSLDILEQANTDLSPSFLSSLSSEARAAYLKKLSSLSQRTLSLLGKFLSSELSDLPQSAGTSETQELQGYSYVSLSRAVVHKTSVLLASADNLLCAQSRPDNSATTFEDVYMNLLTSSFEDELDALRMSEGFGASKMATLTEYLRSGTNIYSKLEAELHVRFATHKNEKNPLHQAL
eukprot:TRINITY_DN1161_c0_g1_i3.p1 TRINITY_DN1161_c0_g1~~TRINITY_DN1161_c0_g1_i3.p1  ORF type:complete len:285 (+),score=48.81 TRINITY_DN1161_c0_g1_i3:81-935(+)